MAVDHERRAAVLAALDTLPLDQRAALVLVDMEGYSVEEAAAILGLRPGHGEEPLRPRAGPGCCRCSTEHPGPGRPRAAANPRGAPARSTATRAPTAADHRPRTSRARDQPVTPEQEEQVRRALAAAAGPDAAPPRMPPEVVARLDGVLAELADARVTAAGPARPGRGPGTRDRHARAGGGAAGGRTCSSPRRPWW